MGSRLRHELVQDTAQGRCGQPAHGGVTASGDGKGERATRPATGTWSRVEFLLNLLLPLWGRQSRPPCLGFPAVKRGVCPDLNLGQLRDCAGLAP